MASTSPYRRALLERLGLSFECRAPGVDEAPHAGETGEALVQRLALAKARAVAAQRPDAWVIGSDQAAVLGDAPHERLFGKPGSRERAVESLQASSGRTLRYLTGVALVRGAECHQMIDVTRVRFRTLDADSIERYLERDAPFDCAGAFKSEALGISLCEAIESDDPTALIGLPLIGVAALLRAAGYRVP